MADTTRALEARMRTIAHQLCNAIRVAIEAQPAIDATGGIRPVHLTTHLHLDKSLASRIVQALEAATPLEALLRVPAPKGLAILERALRARGTVGDELVQLRSACERYDELLTDFRGGRRDLDVALSSYVPTEQERVRRDARRTIFRARATLEGARASAHYSARYVVPSMSGERVDILTIELRQDLHRLRSDARLPIANVPPNATTLAGDSGEQPTLTALPIRDTCTHPIPTLTLDESSRELTVPIQALGLNAHTTLGLGWWNRDARSTAQTFATHVPSEALVIDLFVHRDLCDTAPPIASIERGADTTHTAPPKHNRRRVDAPPLVDLSAHPSGLSSSKVRRCAAIAETACREAGLELAAFVPFRATLTLPLADERVSLWWPKL